MSYIKTLLFHATDEQCTNRKGFSDYRPEGSCVGHEASEREIVLRLATLEQLAQTLVNALADGYVSMHMEYCCGDDDHPNETCREAALKNEYAALALAAEHGITPGGKK